jgi:hypothetical protein
MGENEKGGVVRIIALFAGAVLGSLGSAMAAPPEPLKGAQIEALFSGATMRGDFLADGSAWAERTTKSGRVLDMLQGGKHAGAWFVAGDRMCYIYFGKPPSQPCYVILRDGNTILFHDPKTGAAIARATSVEPSRR